MAHRRRAVRTVLFAAVLPLLSLPGAAQLVLGQYEDEAPFRSWNSFPFVSAGALGRGETGFAAAGEAAAAFANPAVLPTLPPFTLTLGGSVQAASFSKYGPVNTGIFHTAEPVWLGFSALDFGGLTVRSGRWAFALSVSLAEIYDRPPAEYVYKPRELVLYRIRFDQTGLLRLIGFSAGYRLGPSLSLGLGLNLAAGRMDRSLGESWTSSRISINDGKSHRYSGAFVNGGLLWDPGPALRLAAVFRTPYAKRARSEGRVEYQSPDLPGGIVIAGSARDDLRQPWLVGCGVEAKPWGEVKFFGDMVYAHWPSYEMSWFGDPQRRDFRGSLKIGLGIEFSFRPRIFSAPSEIPFRAGLIRDPQPMKTPASAYSGATAGFGLRWRGFVLDLGVLFARESGSGDGLGGSRVALSLGYGLGERR